MPNFKSLESVQQQMHNAMFIVVFHSSISLYAYFMQEGRRSIHQIHRLQQKLHSLYNPHATRTTYKEEPKVDNTQLSIIGIIATIAAKCIVQCVFSQFYKSLCVLHTRRKETNSLHPPSVSKTAPPLQPSCHLNFQQKRNKN